MSSHRTLAVRVFPLRAVLALGETAWHDLHGEPRGEPRGREAWKPGVQCRRPVPKTEILAEPEARLMRVLELGCGSGRDLASWGVPASDEVTGLDIDDSRLVIAIIRCDFQTELI